MTNLRGGPDLNEERSKVDEASEGDNQDVNVGEGVGSSEDVGQGVDVGVGEGVSRSKVVGEGVGEGAGPSKGVGQAVGEGAHDDVGLANETVVEHMGGLDSDDPIDEGSKTYK
ncbi:hypothetical protein NL676_031100 [Syzygium grande]|nr:hypothetical protein NL676_031100 [Syzygium grande]